MTTQQTVKTWARNSELNMFDGRREMFVCNAVQSDPDGYWVYGNDSRKFVFDTYESADLANQILWPQGGGLGVWHKRDGRWFQVMP